MFDKCIIIFYNQTNFNKGAKMNNNIIDFLQYRSERVNPLTYRDDKYLLNVASKYFTDKDISESRIGKIEDKLE